MKLADLNFHYWLLIILISSVFMPATEAKSFQQSTSIENQSSIISATKGDNPSPLNSSIETLLQQYVRNGSNQLFDGTFVYFFEDKVQTVKVHREKNENGQVVEEFVPMDSKQEKSSRVLDNQYCSLNNDWQYQFQAMSSSFPFRVNNYYRDLQQHYHFSLSDIETIAGTSAIGLLIKSKDPYRYGYQLWFEPQTATLLKYKLVDQKGKVIEQYLFTDITIRNKQALQSDSNAPVQSSSCYHQFQGLTEAFQRSFFENKIPAGYEPISFRKGYINDSDRQAYQFQLSDGLSSVSIYIEATEHLSKTINGVLQLGPVNVAGKTIGQYQVTVIGAIPIVAALHFLKAINLSDQEYSSLK